MGFLKKIGKQISKGAKKLGRGLEKVAKKVAPIALPLLAGAATGGLAGIGPLGMLTRGGLAKTAAYAMGGGLLASKLLRKKSGGKEAPGAQPGDAGFDDPAGVGSEIQPGAMPNLDAASVEEARRLALLKRQQAAGRRSTILSNTRY